MYLPALQACCWGWYMWLPTWPRGHTVWGHQNQFDLASEQRIPRGHSCHLASWDTGGKRRLPSPLHSWWGGASEEIQRPEAYWTDCIKASWALWMVQTSNRSKEQNTRTSVGWEHLETWEIKEFKTSTFFWHSLKHIDTQCCRPRAEKFKVMKRLRRLSVESFVSRVADSRQGLCVWFKLLSDSQTMQEIPDWRTPT